MDVDDTHPRATPAEEPLEETLKRTPTSVGRVLSGRYRIEAMLAAGGMGEVYRVAHVELGRHFALKLMKPELSADPDFVERFRREAMTASRLGHPNIVDIIDSGRSESGQFYFVMEFLDGQTLTSLIERGPVELPLALELTTQIARALEVAHKAGVVHRDLKPDNVIVLQRAHGPVAKIVDFGIAKVVTPSHDIKQTTHGVIMGTPQYMAPEQAAGVALDLRADVYALGLILYELLVGKPPLTGQTAALVMSAHISTPAPALPAEFPAPLRELVARMLAKRPAERPASMTEVLETLDKVPRKLARKPPIKPIAVVAACAVIGFAAVFLQKSPRPHGGERLGEGPNPVQAAVLVDAGTESQDAGPAEADAGVPDAGIPDAGIPDAGAPAPKRPTTPPRKKPATPGLKSFPTD